MASHEWQPVDTNGVSTCATCPAVRWESGPILVPVERCRCTTVAHGERAPSDWRDVDRDGMIDMVYLREDKSTMQLYTHYNRL